MNGNTPLRYGLACLFVLSLLLNVVLLSSRKGAGEQPQTDTARITVTDTISYLQPIPTDSLVVRYETVRIPYANDTALRVERPTANDSLTATIPITQKRYQDSTYTAWVSGYDPKLDSISIYPRHEILTITKTVRQKPKRWGIGLNVGYGFTPKYGMQPYVGVGIQYNLLGF